MSKLLLLCLFLAACATPHYQGKALSKEYDDPDDWMTMTCYSYDKRGNCTMNIPTWHHDPEHYIVYFEDCSNGDSCDKFSRYTTKEFYDSVKMDTVYHWATPTPGE